MITLNVFPDEMVRFYKNEGLEYAEKLYCGWEDYIYTLMNLKS